MSRDTSFWINFQPRSTRFFYIQGQVANLFLPYRLFLQEQSMGHHSDELRVQAGLLEVHHDVSHLLDAALGMSKDSRVHTITSMLARCCKGRTTMGLCGRA